MKRLTVIAAATAAGLTVLLASSGGGPAQPREGSETLGLKVRLTLIGAHGPRVADVHAFSGTLEGGGAPGEYRGSCVVTDPGPQRLQCNVTATLPGRGEIVAVGSVGPGGVGTMVVVGGTGDFKNARGVRTLGPPQREGSDVVADITYRLSGVRR